MARSRRCLEMAQNTLRPHACTPLTPTLPPTILAGHRIPGSRRAAAQILRADTPPCALYDRKCAGKADNPNCLCGLIPAPTGHRRQGLWQKDAAALAKLGPDPSADKRAVQERYQAWSRLLHIACASHHSRHTCPPLSRGKHEDIHARRSHRTHVPASVARYLEISWSVVWLCALSPSIAGHPEACAEHIHKFVIFIRLFVTEQCRLCCISRTCRGRWG